MSAFLISLLGNYDDKRDKKVFNTFILYVILFNSVTLGLESIFFPDYNNLFTLINKICLYIFVVEILLKLLAWRSSFFKSGWNIFDLLIIIVCMIPMPTLSILRALRVLRVFRILSAFNKTRRLITALLNALPSMFSVIFLLFLFFYIYSILCTHLFGSEFPKYFGSLPKSVFSLFQIMTFESWSESIVRPVMNIYPYAGVIFISFIFITSYCILNLVVGIIVTSMQAEAVDNCDCSENEQILLEVHSLKEELLELRKSLAQRK
ncbi:TPA: ion transporter, partial [Pasteurella multocida]|nr:voltage-gated sodium channel [Pasteurella multocida subsp. gallicida X73]OBP26420.1 hypothetical protein A0R63_10015 [Pasteurella multocida subsp. multocida]SUB37154.1 Ion transport protein [Pasteurella multocida]HDR1302439.1 ion transporter [Pasteurella multocida]